MPRTSEKQQHIRRMHSHMGERIVSRLFRTVTEDDDSVEDAKDAAFASMIRVAESRRYLFRSQVYRKSPFDRFKEDMHGRADEEDEDDVDDATELELINREAAWVLLASLMTAW